MKGALLAHPPVGWRQPTREATRPFLSSSPAVIHREADILMVAAKRGHAEVVRFLVYEVCVPLAPVGVPGITALHVACEGGHEAVVELLLEMGAYAGPVAFRRVLGWSTVAVTPLAEAAGTGALGCARLISGR
jgi:ankyrin repeat protein